MVPAKYLRLGKLACLCLLAMILKGLAAAFLNLVS